MALGAALAVWGLVSSAQLAGVEPDYSTTKRGATCAAVLVVAAAYSFTGFRRWSTWRAIPFFLLSYILVGVTVMVQMGSIVKDFAPDDPSGMDYAVAYGKIVGAFAVAILLAADALWAATTRRSPATSQNPGQAQQGQ